MRRSLGRQSLWPLRVRARHSYLFFFPIPPLSLSLFGRQALVPYIVWALVTDVQLMNVSPSDSPQPSIRAWPDDFPPPD